MCRGRREKPSGELCREIRCNINYNKRIQDDLVKIQLVFRDKLTWYSFS